MKSQTPQITRAAAARNTIANDPHWCDLILGARESGRAPAESILEAAATPQGYVELEELDSVLTSLHGYGVELDFPEEMPHDELTLCRLLEIAWHWLYVATLSTPTGRRLALADLDRAYRDPGERKFIVNTSEDRPADLANLLAALEPSRHRESEIRSAARHGVGEDRASAELASIACESVRDLVRARLAPSYVWSYSEQVVTMSRPFEPAPESPGRDARLESPQNYAACIAARMGTVRSCAAALTRLCEYEVQRKLEATKHTSPSLQAAAHAALWKACQKYDARRGYSFWSYTQHWVDHMLEREIKRLNDGKPTTR